jgi:N-methylhydantoinase A
MPRMYDIGWTKPRALVERYLRQVVDERVNAAALIERVRSNRASDCRARRSTRCSQRTSRRLALLLHSFTNRCPKSCCATSIRARRRARACLSLSAEVLAEIMEYERTVRRRSVNA